MLFGIQKDYIELLDAMLDAVLDGALDTNSVYRCLFASPSGRFDFTLLCPSEFWWANLIYFLPFKRFRQLIFSGSRVPTLAHVHMIWIIPKSSKIFKTKRIQSPGSLTPNPWWVKSSAWLKIVLYMVGRIQLFKIFLIFLKILIFFVHCLPNLLLHFLWQNKDLKKLLRKSEKNTENVDSSL